MVWRIRMPLFKYKCTQCEHEEHKLNKWTVKEIDCEKCGSLSKKAFSSGCAAIKVKGKGAYTNKMRV